MGPTSGPGSAVTGGVGPRVGRTADEWGRAVSAREWASGERAGPGASPCGILLGWPKGKEERALWVWALGCAREAGRAGKVGRARGKGGGGGLGCGAGLGWVLVLGFFSFSNTTPTILNSNEF